MKGMSFFIPLVGLMTIVWVVRVGAVLVVVVGFEMVVEEGVVAVGAGVVFSLWTTSVGVVLVPVTLGVGVKNNVLTPTPTLPVVPPGLMVVSIGTTMDEDDPSSSFGLGAGSDGELDSTSPGTPDGSAREVVDDEIVYTADQVGPV